MIAETIVQFDDVLALADRLTPLEKMKLVKRMMNALGQEPVLTTTTVTGLLPPDEQHWGKELVALLDTLDLRDWQAIDMPDVVDWVKQQRAEQERKRGILWEDEE